MIFPFHSSRVCGSQTKSKKKSALVPCSFLINYSEPMWLIWMGGVTASDLAGDLRYLFIQVMSIKHEAYRGTPRWSWVRTSSGQAVTLLVCGSCFEEHFEDVMTRDSGIGTFFTTHLCVLARTEGARCTLMVGVPLCIKWMICQAEWNCRWLLPKRLFARELL